MVNSIPVEQRTQFEYDITPLEIGGSGGDIYLPWLVLHRTAWST